MSDLGGQSCAGLAYLRTGDGPDVGNVVLRMQPYGTLNRSANPPDSPEPSDSADSYWRLRWYAVSAGEVSGTPALRQ